MRLVLIAAGFVSACGATALAAAPAPPPEPAPTRTERPCTPAAPDERFDVDFAQVPLAALARLVSCAAEWNLMFAPTSLSQKVITVVAPRPVPLRELKQLWAATLAEHDLETERRGGYRVIRPAAP